MFAKTNLANTTVEETIEAFTTFFEQSLGYIGHNMKQIPGSAPFFQCFQKTAFEVTNYMRSYNTHHKLVTGLKRKNIYFEPSLFVVKERTVEELGELDEEQSHGVIMPIEKNIKHFLQMPNVFNAIMENQNRLVVDGCFHNFIDGKLWKDIKSRFEGKNVIPIFLYTDDFQPDSSISPHSAGQKLGAYYYSFPTLPDHLAMNLKYIFIAALIKHADMDSEEVMKQGFDPALYALFEVFSSLEQNGVTITIDGTTETVYIVLPQLLGDNLGINGALGFLTGFTAKYICRICLIPREIRERATWELTELLRNKENYEECLSGRATNRDERREEKKGVKYNCVLNFLDNFKVYENFSVDLMHDCFLGVFKIGIAVILDYYIIQRQTFTLEDFNKAKKKFDYGRKNIGNKTSDISDAHLLNGLQMNAKEVWTLVEFLPLILKDLVENHEHCPVFKFALKMGELLESVTKSSFTEADISEMLTRVADHHRMFLELFDTPDSPKHFTPKFHTMLHYGTIIRLTGPLKKTMVFRLEQKHQELKQYAKACHSRVNLPLSICKKFILNTAKKFLDKEDILSLITEVAFKRQTDLLGTYPNDVSNPINSVKYKAVSYNLDDIVYHENEAFRIVEIVRDCGKEDIFLFSKKLVCQFSENLGFFVIVEESRFYETFRTSDLRFAPVNSHKVSNTNYFKLKCF